MATDRTAFRVRQLSPTEREVLEAFLDRDDLSIVIATPLTATDATRVVFTALRAMQFEGVKTCFTTASTSGTLTVEKLTGTTAPGSGTALLSAVVALSGTANSPASGTLIGTTASLQFAAGDRVGIVIAGTMTNLVGGLASLAFSPI